jgi:hypothetical protein
MTSAQIRLLIYQITGYQVGTRLNTGSMREHLTFAITKRNNPAGASFSKEQRQQLGAAFNYLGTYVGSQQIDIKLKYITQDKNNCPSVQKQFGFSGVGTV